MGDSNKIVADATGRESRAIGILEVGTLTMSGRNNYIKASAAGFDSRAGGIIDIVDGAVIISGNNNQIIGSKRALSNSNKKREQSHYR